LEGFSTSGFGDRGAIEGLHVDRATVFHTEGRHTQLGESFRDSLLGDLAVLVFQTLERLFRVLDFFLEGLGSTGEGCDTGDLLVLDLQSIGLLLK